MKNIIYLLCLAFLFIISSCKTTSYDKSTAQSKSGIKLNNQNIRTANFTSLSVSIDVDGRKISSRASLKLIRDSIIQIAVQPILGIEIVRVEFTPQRFLVIDKFNSKYFSGNYDMIHKLMRVKIGYYDLEAMLLNQPFVLGENRHLTESDVNSLFLPATYPDGIILQSKAHASPALTEFTFDKNNNLFLANVLLGRNMLNCNYSNFVKHADNIIFPLRYKLTVQNGNESYNAELTISNAEFNKQLKINDTNLSRYRQVKNIEELIPNK